MIREMKLHWEKKGSDIKKWVDKIKRCVNDTNRWLDDIKRWGG